MACAAVSAKQPHQVYLTVFRRNINKAVIQIVRLITLPGIDSKRQVGVSMIKTTALRVALRVRRKRLSDENRAV